MVSTRDRKDLGKSDEHHLKHAFELGAVVLTHGPDLLKIAHRCNQGAEEHKGILYVHPPRLIYRRMHSDG